MPNMYIHSIKHLLIYECFTLHKCQAGDMPGIEGFQFGNFMLTQVSSSWGPFILKSTCQAPV